MSFKSTTVETDDYKLSSSRKKKNGTHRNGRSLSLSFGNCVVVGCVFLMLMLNDVDAFFVPRIFGRRSSRSSPTPVKVEEEKKSSTTVKTSPDSSTYAFDAEELMVSSTKSVVEEKKSAGESQISPKTSEDSSSTAQSYFLTSDFKTKVVESKGGSKKSSQSTSVGTKKAVGENPKKKDVHDVWHSVEISETKSKKPSKDSESSSDEATPVERVETTLEAIASAETKTKKTKDVEVEQQEEIREDDENTKEREDKTKSGSPLDPLGQFSFAQKKKDTETKSSGESSTKKDPAATAKEMVYGVSKTASSGSSSEATEDKKLTQSITRDTGESTTTIDGGKSYTADVLSFATDSAKEQKKKSDEKKRKKSKEATAPASKKLIEAAALQQAQKLSGTGSDVEVKKTKSPEPVPSPASIPSPSVQILQSPESSPSVQILQSPESSPSVQILPSPESVPSPSVQVLPSPESIPSPSPSVQVLPSPESIPSPSPSVPVSPSPESIPSPSPSVQVLPSPESIPSPSPSVQVLPSPESIPSPSPSVQVLPSPESIPSPSVPVSPSPESIPSPSPSVQVLTSPESISPSVPLSSSPESIPSPALPSPVLSVPVLVSPDIVPPAVQPSEPSQEGDSDDESAEPSIAPESEDEGSPLTVIHKLGDKTAVPSIEPVSEDETAVPSIEPVSEDETAIPSIEPESAEGEPTLVPVSLYDVIEPSLAPVSEDHEGESSVVLAAASVESIIKSVHASVSTVSPDIKIVSPSPEPTPVQPPVEPPSEPPIMATPEPKASSAITREPSAAEAEESSEALFDQLSDIVEEKEGVEVGVEVPGEGKVGIFIKEGGTVKLKGKTLVVPEDVAVAIKVSKGNLEMEDVIIRFKTSLKSQHSRTLLRPKSLPSQKGLLISDGAQVEISNSTFEGSTDSMVAVSGGASFHCSECIFHSNQAVFGGALNVKGASAVLNKCTLTNNRANYGGAVYVSGNTYGDSTTLLTVLDSSFERNKGTSEGGSLMIKNADKVKIENSIFKLGLGAKGGAAVIKTTNELLVSSSHFRENIAEVYGGGALYIAGTRTTHITGTVFKSNKAMRSTGGALALDRYSSFSLKKSEFNSNSAKDGGAIAVLEKSLTEGNLTVVETRFEKNFAKRTGGAVFMKTLKKTRSDSDFVTGNDAYIGIERSEFSENSAANGGAIFTSGTSGEEKDIRMAIMNTSFTSNEAHNAGGGVYCGLKSHVHVAHSVFTDNKAEKGTSCASYCGCHLDFDDSFRSKGDPTVDNSWYHEDQDACETTVALSAAYTSQSNGDSNALLYILVTLGVLCALIVASIAIVLKNKHLLQTRNAPNDFHRTLSYFAGPSRMLDIPSVPFSECPSGTEIESRLSGQDDNIGGSRPALESHFLGEIDAFPEGIVNRRQSILAESISASMEDEDGVAEAFFGDHAFNDDWDNTRAPLLPTISNLSQRLA